jgi:Uma2 family endonuclease
MPDEDTDRMSAQPVEVPPGLMGILAQRPLTVDDLFDDETPGRKEIVDGGLFVSPLADIAHQRLVMRLARLLGDMPPPASGIEALPGANVSPDPHTLVMPDIVVVGPDVDGLMAHPSELLFIVEITSPSTRRHDLIFKRELYREWKVPFVIVDRGQTPAALIVEGDLPEWFDREPLLDSV